MSDNTPESSKRCPDCAEIVKTAAKVCRFCGFRWAEAEVGMEPLVARRPTVPPMPVSMKMPSPSATAVASLVLGLLGLIGSLVTLLVTAGWLWVLFAIMGVIASILALVSLSEIRKSKGDLVGRGVAIAGLVLGLVGCGISAMVVTAVTAINVIGAHEEVDADAARVLVNTTVPNSLTDYYRRHRNFPGSLQVLVDQKKLRPNQIVDPWNNPLIYERGTTDFKICSVGRDKRPGSSDDICNSTE